MISLALSLYNIYIYIYFSSISKPVKEMKLDLGTQIFMQKHVYNLQPNA